MTEQQAKTAAADSLITLIRGLNTRPSNSDHFPKAEIFIQDFYAYLLAKATSKPSHNDVAGVDVDAGTPAVASPAPARRPFFPTPNSRTANQ